MTKDVNVEPIPDDIEIIQNKATMCDKIIYNDAEPQCDSIPKRSITLQTLAQSKSAVKACKESRMEPKKLFSKEVEEQ